MLSTRRMTLIVAALLLLPPAAAILAGQQLADLLVGPNHSAPTGLPSTLGDGHLFGTDFAGRSVLAQALTGGRSAFLLASTATLVILLIAVPLGLWAGLTLSRARDEAIMRPLDVPLAVPSLLFVLTCAAFFRQPWLPVLVAVGCVGVAETTRLVRSAAVHLRSDPAVEAMRGIGMPWHRVAFGYAARHVSSVLIAHAGVQFTAAMTLISTASFLGIGVDPSQPDWAAMVEANRGTMAIQPWAVVLPSALLACLVVGVNLLVFNISGLAAESVPLQSAVAASSPPGAGEPTLLLRDVCARSSAGSIFSGVTLTASSGLVHVIMGPSGCGKSTLAKTILREASPGVTVAGTVHVKAQRTVLIPQQAAAHLNPRRRVGSVLKDIAAARGVTRRAQVAHIDRVLSTVRLPPFAQLQRRYSHQLSGGQQQRLLVAHALLAEADLLVADEPTAGQDTLSLAAVGEILAIAAREGLCVIVFTHDQRLSETIGDTVLHMTSAGLTPQHSSALTSHRPAVTMPAPSCSTKPLPDAELCIGPLTARFEAHVAPTVVTPAITVLSGARVAILGASGSGKTTFARCLAGLHRHVHGALSIAGQPVPLPLAARTREQRAVLRYVYQDARGAFDPYRSVVHQVAEAAELLRLTPRAAARDQAVSLLAAFDVPVRLLTHPATAWSGGQLQRAGLARALIAEPRVLICDEVTSALDSATTQCILERLDAVTSGMTVLMITHDLVAAEWLCHDAIVFDAGRVADHGAMDDVWSGPVAPATHELFSARPVRT